VPHQGVFTKIDFSISLAKSFAANYVYQNAQTEYKKSDSRFVRSFAATFLIYVHQRKSART
jgi:hypothetical protein